MVCGAPDFYLPVPRHGRSPPKRRQHRPPQILREGSGPRVKGLALLVVDDHHAATFPEPLVYDRTLQDADRAYLFASEKALWSLAENFVGLTF